MRSIYGTLDDTGRTQLLSLARSAGSAGTDAGLQQLGVVSDNDDTAFPTQYKPDGPLGYKGADAVATPDAAATRVVQVRHEPRAHAPSVLRRSSRVAAARSAIDVASFHHSRPAVRRHGALRQVPTNDLVSAGGAAAAPEQQRETQQLPQPAAPAAASTVGAVTAPVTGPVTVPVTTTVVPTSTTVSTPVLTVTVTVPTVTVPPPPHP